MLLRHGTLCDFRERSDLEGVGPVETNLGRGGDDLF